MFSPHLNKLRTFMTTSPRRNHTTTSKQPTHLHDHCSPHRDHTTILNNTMKLTCAAHHLCALANVPIPIKLPGDKSDTSPSAPDEPKHTCEHCREPMHGGICGHNFTDVLDSLDKTKLHKDEDETHSIALICLPCYHDLLLTKIITSPAPANTSAAATPTIALTTTEPMKKAQTTLAGSKQKATEDNAKPAPKKKCKTKVVLTNQQKLDILNELDNKVITIAAVCDKYGMHHNAVGRWKKNWDNFRKQVEEEGPANKKKASADDGLRRVRLGIRAFYELNETLPKSLKLPLTRELLLV